MPPESLLLVTLLVTQLVVRVSPWVSLHPAWPSPAWLHLSGLGMGWVWGGLCTGACLCTGRGPQVGGVQAMWLSGGLGRVERPQLWTGAGRWLLPRPSCPEGRGRAPPFALGNVASWSCSGPPPGHLLHV